MSTNMYYGQPTQEVNTHRGLAIAGFVLAVVGAIFGFIPLTCVVAIICGVLGLIFGLLGRKHGLGKAGAIISVAAIALGIWGAVIVNQAVDDYNNDVNCISNAQTVEQMDQC